MLRIFAQKEGLSPTLAQALISIIHIELMQYLQMLSQGDNSIIYGLDYQARAMCAVAAEQEKSQFIIGTQTLKFENQLCLLEVEEETNQIEKTVFPHKQGGVWHLATNPTDKHMVASCHSRVEGTSVVCGCTVYRMQTQRQPALETVSSFPNIASTPCCFEWHPENQSRAAVLYEKKLAVVDLDSGSTTMKVSSECDLTCKTAAVVCRWNPHHNCNILAVACDSNVRAIDVRTNTPAFTLDSCHTGAVRAMSFNANRQYYMATGGEDSMVHVWDTRNSSSPAASIGVHSHWVCGVEFNPIHDQLLLTCSSDAKLVLYCLQSVSSDDDTLLEDHIINTYDQHEESVYACHWSAADPWLFASLSYHGRVLINHVPTNTKYQTLQL